MNVIIINITPPQSPSLSSFSLHQLNNHQCILLIKNRSDEDDIEEVSDLDDDDKTPSHAPGMPSSQPVPRKKKAKFTPSEDITILQVIDLKMMIDDGWKIVFLMEFS